MIEVLVSAADTKHSSSDRSIRNEKGGPLLPQLRVHVLSFEIHVETVRSSLCKSDDRWAREGWRTLLDSTLVLHQRLGAGFECKKCIDGDLAVFERVAGWHRTKPAVEPRRGELS
jgi:hypothetical protein